MDQIENPVTSYEKARTAYFGDFAQSHLSAFRPHYKHGETLGSKKNPETWRNVSEHCLVAGVFADILADELHLPVDQKELVIKAVIVHDWYKKHEVIAQQTARKEGTLSLVALFKIKAEDSQILQTMGVPQDIITLAGANIPETAEGPETLIEKIVWYVDAMLSNTNPVSIQQRFDDLERGWDGIKEDAIRAERNIVFSDLYREKYNGRSLYDVQRALGDKIGAEFVQLMEYQGEVAQLPFFLKEKLDERIAAR